MTAPLSKGGELRVVVVEGICNTDNDAEDGYFGGGKHRLYFETIGKRVAREMQRHLGHRVRVVVEHVEKGEGG